MLTIGSCSAVASSAGTLNVDSISGTVANQSTCAGTNAAFTVSATYTGSGAISYQWQLNHANAGYGNISGATSSSYTVTVPTAAANGDLYRCMLTIGSCSAVASSAGTLNIDSISGTVANQSTCAGTNATFTVSTTHTGSGAISYQWQLNHGTGYNNVSGATSSSYTVMAPTAATNGDLYRCMLTIGSCSAVASSAGTLNVDSISGTVANQSTCAGTNATFTVSATYTGSGAISYQWQLNHANAGYGNISAATSSSYTVTAPTAAAHGDLYRCMLTIGSCSAVASPAGTLNVDSISGTVANQSTCAGTNAAFSVSATYTGSGAISYQWQLNHANAGYGNISAATSSSYTVTAPTAAAHGDLYRCMLTIGSCSVVASSAGTLNVDSISGTVANQSTCAGTNAAFTVSTTHTGSGAIS